MFDGFDGFGHATGGGSTNDGSGCIWQIIWFCIAVLLVIGILKWLS